MAWQDLLDKLVDWKQNPEQLEDDGLIEYMRFQGTKLVERRPLKMASEVM